MKPLYQQLLSRRLAAGLSQQDVAARANVRQATVSAVENGQDVRLSTMEKIAAAMGVSLMLGNEPLPFPKDFREAKSRVQRQFLGQGIDLNPFRNTEIRVPSVSWSEPW